MTDTLNSTGSHDAPVAVATEQASPEDQAAYTFGQQLPVFKAIVAGMSNKSLRRVLCALVEYPLQDGELRFANQTERQLFMLGLSLQDCKQTMYNAVALERMKEKKEENK